MHRAFSDAVALVDGLPEGYLDFDLVTPDQDTYRTRLDPMGGTFHSPARPWLDSHRSETAKNVVGSIVEVVEQSPQRFRVRVRFDVEKPDAAEVYRQHVAGFLKGCSVGFLPEPGATHLEFTAEGKCDECRGKGELHGFECFGCFGTGRAGAVLVYDKFKVLEGSSCAVPANPMALCVRTAADAGEARRRMQAAQQTAQHHPSHAQHPTSHGAPPMNRDQCNLSRWLVSDEMAVALTYMELSAASADAGFMERCRAAARACMSNAKMLAEAVAASMDEAPEAPQPTAFRAAPDAELSSDWEACQRAALPVCAAGFVEVGKALAKDPAELRTNAAAQRAVEAKYRKLLTEQRTAAQKTEESERQTLVFGLPDLEPGLEAEMLGLDPVGYTRGAQTNVRRGQPWSAEQIRKYAIQVEGAVAQVTRTAPIKTADGSPPPAEMQPAAPQRRSAMDPTLAAALDALAKRGGLSPEAVRKAAEGGARAVEGTAMNDRIRETEFRPLNPNGGAVVVNDGAAAPADRRFKVQS